jgi:hypothetical protein
MKFREYLKEAESIQWSKDRNTTFDKVTISKNGEVVAKIMYSLDFPKDGLLNIEWAETNDKFKKSGYASKLVAALKKKYPKYRIRGLTQKSNTAAIKLLQKFGGKIDH